MLLLQTLTVEHVELIGHNLVVIGELLAHCLVLGLQIFQIGFAVSLLRGFFFAIVLEFFAQRLVVGLQSLNLLDLIFTLA